MTPVTVFIGILVITFVVMIVMLRPTATEKTLEKRLRTIERASVGAIPDEVADLLRQEKLSDIPWLNDVATGVQMLASERGMPINGTYSTRTKRKCDVEEREWPNLELRTGALYVLLPRARAVASRFEARGGKCGALETVRVCSTNE